MAVSPLRLHRAALQLLLAYTAEPSEAWCAVLNGEMCTAPCALTLHQINGGTNAFLDTLDLPSNP